MNIRFEANLLGALAIAIADRIATVTTGSGTLSPNACAVLITLGTNPGDSIDALAKIVGLSHSATVRLVASLEKSGLVARTVGEDRRSVALRLTREGRCLRDRLCKARLDALEESLSVLPRDERTRFVRSARLMLGQLTDGRGTADHICRLCDETVCQRAVCPVERCVARPGE